MRKLKFFCIIFCISFFISCAPSPVSSKTETALNTVCTIQLFEYGTEKMYKKLFERLDEIERQLSVTIPSSEISHINKAAGDFPVKVTAGTFNLIDSSLGFAKESSGAFNPVMGSLVSLWNITAFDSIKDSLPSPVQVEEARKKTDYLKVKLDAEKQSVYLTDKGMILDLGGIAKGWAADELISLISGAGIPYAIINLGGNIYAYGEKANGEQWNIGIKNPFDSNASPVISIKTDSTSIVTSGVYERFFVKDGVMYHHILDMNTGYPVQNGLVSVTIVHSSSMTADALSTMVFALGKKKGLEYLNSNNIKGILITEDHEVYASEGIKNAVSMLDDDFICMR